MNGKASYHPDGKENTRRASAPRIKKIENTNTKELEKTVRELRDKCIAIHRYTNEEIEKMAWQIERIQQELNRR